MPEMMGLNAVTESLKPHAVAMDSVTPHPENMRDGNIPAIAQSLARYGQVKPIVVQESTGSIAAIHVDMDDRTALAYLIADNKTSDLGTYHRQRLVSNLQRIADLGWLAETLWSADELDDLFAETEASITSPEAFKGTFALTDEQIEQFRAAGQQSGAEAGARRFREVPLLLREEDHREFIENVSRLEGAWETQGKVNTIVEAVRRCAEALPPPVVSPLREDKS
jgi:hypothetical protein